MPDVVMPRLSDSMEEGTILKWLKADGDEVAKGDPIVEIETDKATMTYEADAAGVLAIVAQEGDTLPIGEPIARIGEGASGAGAPRQARSRGRGRQSRRATRPRPPRRPRARRGAAPERAARRGRAAPRPRRPAPPPPDGGRPKASPLARRIARERGVDLGRPAGSGPGGRIVKADVEAGVRRHRGARRRPAEAEREARRGARGPEPAPATARASAARPRATSRSRSRRAPSSSSRGAWPSRRPPSRSSRSRPTSTWRAASSCAPSSRPGRPRSGPRRPSTTWSSRPARSPCASSRGPTAPTATGTSSSTARVNVGVAVAARTALVVPTVFDADRKGLGEIARETRALAERVRDGRHAARAERRDVHGLQPRDVRASRNFTAVINPPQAAILAVGELAPRAGGARRRGRGRATS